MAKRRIMFLIYSLCGSGAERVLTDTANMLVLSGQFDIAVRALFDDSAGAARLDPSIHYRAALRLKPGPARKLASGFIQHVLPPGLVYRWLCGGQFDIEAAFMEAFPTKVLAYSNKPHVKKYAWVHIDVGAYTAQDRLFRSVAHQKRCYEQFDKICCVSADVRDAFVRKFGLKERTCVVYNQLSPAYIRAQSKQPCAGLPEQRPLIVSIGSLTERKRFGMLIEVCARLKRAGLSFRLLILGEGPQRHQLEKLIRRLDLEREVSLMGYCSNPYPYLAAADLYVCSSRAEGYSTAVSEALILGVPVVTAACAGMAELLGSGGEYGLITAGTESALFEGIYRLLYDGALLSSHRAKAAQRGEFLAARTDGAELKKLFEER